MNSQRLLMQWCWPSQRCSISTANVFTWGWLVMQIGWFVDFFYLSGPQVFWKYTNSTTIYRLACPVKMTRAVCVWLQTPNARSLSSSRGYTTMPDEYLPSTCFVGEYAVLRNSLTSSILPRLHSLRSSFYPIISLSVQDKRVIFLLPLLVASSSRAVSTEAAGKWTYRTTLPRMNTFLTDDWIIRQSGHTISRKIESKTRVSQNTYQMRILYIL